MGCVEESKIIDSSISDKYIIPLCHDINYKEQENATIKISPELDRLKQFLLEDKTDKINYNAKYRGIDWFVCTGFTRTLEANASKYNISLGGVEVRDTPTIGSASKSLHALNYGIFDNKFYFIEPQNDCIYTIDEYNNLSVYKYASLHKNTSSIYNFKISRKTIDLNLNNYNETELINKWKL